MKFNTDKCKVLHFGAKNLKNNYSFIDAPINSASGHKDLGVIISSDLKPHLQCNSAAMKANRSLRMIARAVKYKTKSNMLLLFNSLVRPHLEYAIQSQSPHYRKGITQCKIMKKNQYYQVSIIWMQSSIFIFFNQCLNYVQLNCIFKNVIFVSIMLSNYASFTSPSAKNEGIKLTHSLLNMTEKWLLNIVITSDPF